MKITKYIMLLMIGAFLMTSCDEEVVGYDEEAIDFETADAYLKIVTTGVELVEGVSDYSFRFIVIPGVEDIAKVNVYKQVTFGGTQEVSDKVLAYSYDIDDTQLSTNIESDVRVSELMDGIVATNPESVLDTIVDSLVSGTLVTFTFEVLRSDGSAANTTDEAAKKIVFTYLPNPYKGTYITRYGSYWRVELQVDANGDPLGEDLTNYINQTRTIGALNDTALTHPDWWGGFDWAGNEFIFYAGVNDAANPTDSSIRVTIPTTIDGVSQPLFSGSRMITPEEDGCGSAGAFNHNRVPGVCDQMIVPDAGGPGVHRIYLTYGYFTDGSGEREFYEILEKIGD